MASQGPSLSLAFCLSLPLLSLLFLLHLRFLLTTFLILQVKSLLLLLNLLNAKISGGILSPRDFPLESLHGPPFVQNAVIRAVTVAICAAMHHLMKMAASASDTDSNDILAFYLFTRRRRRKRRYRRISVHPSY